MPRRVKCRGSSGFNFKRGIRRALNQTSNLLEKETCNLLDARRRVSNRVVANVTSFNIS